MPGRLRSPHKFGERSVLPGSIDPHDLYYIAFAGEGKTEHAYFDGIRECAEELGISEQIRIEPLEKEDEEDTKSHPKYVFELLEERSENPSFGYDPDEMWIVVDRDSQNVKREQLEELIRLCGEKGYHLALSNPTFELWLLLHLADVDDYDREVLLLNAKSSQRGKRFLQKEIGRLCGDGYNKSNLVFERFKMYIGQAIERAKQLDTDNTELLDKLGSSVCVLAEHIMQSKNVSNTKPV